MHVDYNDQCLRHERRARRYPYGRKSRVTILRLHEGPKDEQVCAVEHAYAGVSVMGNVCGDHYCNVTDGVGGATPNLVSIENTRIYC